MYGFFFKAVVQVVLLFGEETWVVPSFMGKYLGGFHTQVARRLTGRFPQRIQDKRWRYTSAAMEEAGFLTMEEYIGRQKETVAQYIAPRSLLDLCEESERVQGARVGMWWRKKVGIDLAGAQEASVATAEGDRGE